LAFLAVMVVLIFFSIGYGALTRFVPNPGAFYAYITAGLGRPTGLGSSFLILGSYLSIGVGFYGFAGIAAKQLIEGFDGPVLDWWMYSLICWASVATLAYFHVAISAKVLGILLIAEVLGVIYFDAAVMFQGGPEGISLQPFTPDAFLSGQLGLALIFAVALFSGFEATAIYREETKDPDRTIPRATMLVVLFIGIFYALASWALITGLGASQAVRLSAADPAGVFFTVAKRFCGQIFYDLASVLLLTSVFAAHLAIQNVTTRYTYSLAVDGVFPRYFGTAHARHHSPHRASVFVSCLYLTLVGSLVVLGLSAQNIYAWFAGLASFSILCAMTLTSMAAVAYFRRVKVMLPAWQTTLAPGLASVALLAMVILGAKNFSVLISGSQLLATIMMAGMAAVFALGFVIALWLRHNRPDVYRRIGRQ
jgi:amino acid transporter